MEFSYRGDIERRKFLRLAKKFPLRHSRYIPLNFDDEVLETVTLNIGGGGLLFDSREKYNVSELLKLEIDIPSWEKFMPPGVFQKMETGHEGAFAVKAIVTRAERMLTGTYHIAASFVDLDRGELWALMFAINKK